MIGGNSNPLGADGGDGRVSIWSGAATSDSGVANGEEQMGGRTMIDERRRLGCVMLGNEVDGSVQDFGS